MAATLRVMTANLWGERVDCAGLAAVLAGVDPDVLAVQELTPQAASTITGLFEHHSLEPGPGNEGSGIATRRPAAFARLPFPARAGWTARLDPGDWPVLADPFEVIGVHFANPIGWPWWRSVATRRSQLAAIRAHLDAFTVPAALAGDCNASPMWPAYRRLARLMTDAAVATGSNQRTWTIRGWGPPLLRIDHVFVRGVQATHTGTAMIPGSDHRGVVADLDVRGREHRSPD